MKLPDITLSAYVESETAIQEAETWDGQMRAMLEHYGGVEEEAMKALELGTVFQVLGEANRLRSAIVNGRPDEPNTVMLKDGTVLHAQADPATWTNPRFADAEVYLTAFSGPRLYPALASVVLWPEGHEYETQAGIDRQKALLDCPAYLVMPHVLFFCSNVKRFAHDSPTSTKKPRGVEPVTES